MRLVVGTVGVLGLFMLECSSPSPPVVKTDRDDTNADAVRRGVVYKQTRYSSVLGESVEIEKSPSGAFVRRASGARLSLTEYRDLLKRTARKRFGPFAAGYHQVLSAAAPSAKFRSAVYFRPKMQWETFSKRLFGADPVLRSEAQAELKQATAAQAADLAALARERGLKVEMIGEMMPVVFVAGDAQTTLQLSEVEEATLVTGAEPKKYEARGVPQDSECVSKGATDHVTFHNIDLLNDAGFFADGQGVGILEDSGECELNDNHEAFVQPIVHQQASPTGCFNDHGTGVASIISPNHAGGDRGAGLAKLFYPNVGVPVPFPGPPNATACSPQGTVDAYTWLLSQANPPVKTVNESYGCLHENGTCSNSLAAQWEGVAQDFFARYYGTTIVKAAGNRNCSGQPACPWSLNSICVGSVGSDGQVSCTTSTVNPNWPTQSDREEPDLVAFGGGRTFSQTHGCLTPNGRACFADPAQGPDRWADGTGTSYAAPVVTSMVALYRQACEGLFPNMDQRFIRSTFRTMAFGANPSDFAYSTPHPSVGVDWIDGAGLPLADQLLWSCVPPGTPGVGTTSGWIDLNQDNGPMPPGESEYQNGWDPPGQTQSLGPSSQQPAAFGYQPGPGSNRKWAALGTFNLTDNTRVRATFAWDGCSPNPIGTAPGAVSVDYDLFLYNETTDQYLWASQSMDDNNEGLDYILQAGEGGTIQLIVAWPDGAVSCEGVQYDPVAFSWIYG